jgi:hypothetical protein
MHARLDTLAGAKASVLSDMDREELLVFARAFAKRIAERILP